MPPGNDIRSASAPAPAGDSFPPLEDIIVPIALPMPFSRDPSSKRRDAVVDVSPPRKRASDDDFRAYGAAYSSNSSVVPSSRVDRCWYRGVDDMMSSTTRRSSVVEEFLLSSFASSARQSREKNDDDLEKDAASRKWETDVQNRAVTCEQKERVLRGIKYDVKVGNAFNKRAYTFSHGSLSALRVLLCKYESTLEHPAVVQIEGTFACALVFLLFIERRRRAP